MAFRPITSWKIEGEKVEVVTNFLFLGSKITGRGDCSHEIRRHLLLARKAMTNLDSVLITLPTKAHIYSHFSCVRLFVTPWTAAYQASPSMGFSRQEYWSALPLPSLLAPLLYGK